MLTPILVPLSLTPAARRRLASLRLPRPPPQWISEVLHFCSGLPIILVGCKLDLRFDQRTIAELKKTSQRPVTEQEGQAVATKIGAKHYMECSSRTGQGVREVFQTATRAALLVGRVLRGRRGQMLTCKRGTQGKSSRGGSRRKGEKKCVIL